MVVKTKVAIKNGQSRYTGNIGYTRHINKEKHKTENQKDEQNGLAKIRGKFWSLPTLP